MSTAKTCRSRRRRILAAEDSRIQGRLIERLLSAGGWEVRLAADGGQALEAAREALPDMVISDLVMPVLDGFALCRALRALPGAEDLPILLLSTLANPEDILKGLAAGATDYLIKPYDEAMLLAKVETLMDARHPAPADPPPAPGAAVPFDYGGEQFLIPFDAQSTLRLLTSTYEHAVRQNSALIAAQEDARIANRELTDKVDALARSEQRYRNLVEGTDSGFLRIGPDERFLEVNPAFCAMLRSSRERLLDLNGVGELFAAEQQYRDLLARLAADGRVKGYSCQLLAADDTEVIVEINARRVQDPDGDYWEAFVADVTERVRMENALAASEERFRSMVQLVPDVIFRVDENGVVELVNRAVRQFGYQPADLVGQHISRILCPGEAERLERAVVRARSPADASSADLDHPDATDPGANPGQAIEVRIAPNGADGCGLDPVSGEDVAVVCEVNLAGMYLRHVGGGRTEFLGVVGVIRDITERKRAQRRIEELNRSLERKVEERTRELHNANVQLERSLRQLYATEEHLIQGEKLSAIGTMVGGVVHEINNPLMGALNYVQYAIENTEDARLRGLLRKAEGRVRQVSELAHAMLGYLRQGTAGWSPWRRRRWWRRP
jgi:PAS domain S-box-containing protein